MLQCSVTVVTMYSTLSISEDSIAKYERFAQKGRKGIQKRSEELLRYQEIPFHPSYSSPRCSLGFWPTYRRATLFIVYAETAAIVG